jgi:CIC family chloride channel protein
MSAAVLGAPISTTIMIFELTGDYRLTLSVLVAVVISTLMTKSLHGPSYFLWVLAHRGVVLQGGHEVGALEQPELNTLIRHDHSILNESDSLSSLRDTLVLAVNGEVFVEARGKFSGRLMLSDMGKMAYNEEYDTQKTVIDLVKVTDLFVYETDTLDDAVQVFSGGEDSLVAVLDAPDTKRIVGCLHERDVIRAQLAYVRRLEQLREDEH